MKNILTVTEVVYLKAEKVFSMLVIVNKKKVWIDISEYYVNMILKYCHKIETIEEETFIIYKLKKINK